MSAPGRGPQEVGGGREFRYGWPGVWMVLALLIALALALGVPWGRPLWAVMGGVLILAWIGYVVACLQARALASKGRVCLDDRGLTVRDARGRDETLPWAEVDELLVPRRLSGTRNPWFPIEVRASERCLRIGGSVQDADDLIAAIVTRAGLTDTKRGASATVYTRPTG